MLFLLGVAVLSASCAHKFPDYQPIGHRLPVSQKSVSVEIANPGYVFKVDKIGTPVMDFDYGTKPNLAEYVRSSLVDEFKVAGFMPVSSNDAEIRLEVTIRNIVKAEKLHFFFPYLYLGGGGAFVVDLDVSVGLRGGDRLFLRKFASVKTKSWHLIFIVPIFPNYRKVELSAFQDVCSEIVRETAALVGVRGGGQ